MDISLIIVGSAGLAAAALSGGLYSLWSEYHKSPVDDRLAALLSKQAAPKRNWLRKATWRERIEASLHVLGRAANGVRRFLALYEQADLPLSLPRFLALVGGLAAGGSLLAPILLHDVRFVPVGAIVAGAVPIVWMFWQRSRRLRQFAIQLPESLDLIARAIRSGNSLTAAMRAVIDEMLPPISEEFRRVCDAVSLGTPIEDALELMILRIPSDDLRFFVTAVQIQKQSGGNLAEVLDKTCHCMRDRFRIEGQIQALTGEGRISGTVLLALPVGIFVTMLAVNPAYVDVLFDDQIGWRLLQVSVGLQLVGAFVIQRIVKIDV